MTAASTASSLKDNLSASSSAALPFPTCIKITSEAEQASSIAATATYPPETSSVSAPPRRRTKRRQCLKRAPFENQWEREKGGREEGNAEKGGDGEGGRRGSGRSAPAERAPRVLGCGKCTIKVVRMAQTV